MSSTSRNKRLVFLIVLLIIINLVMLAYFVWFKKQPEQRFDPNKRVGVMIETLRQDVGFTDGQIESYKKLKDTRLQLLKPLVDQMHAAKENLFNLVGEDNVSDSLLDSTASAVGEYQKQIDLLTYNHFKKIRELCIDSAQFERYDSAIPKIFRIAVPGAQRQKDSTNKK